MIWIFAFAAFWLAALLVVDYLISAPVYKGPVSDHFDGKKFGHPYNQKSRTLFDILKWAVNGDRGEWQEVTESPVKKSLPESSSNEDIAVTFVNHSTFLIQIDGFNILTDPTWSLRASPYSWIGPKRMRPPGLRFDDLPEIDAVLITHNHYDHLDLPTCVQLKEQFNPVFITPLGVGQFLEQKKMNTVDLDWWDEHKINEYFKVTAVPAEHFSGRGVFDRDKTLWCGFVLQNPSTTIYYAGDTAYGSFFSEIGDQFPGLDLAFIPIGAYKPRWFMQPIHCDPDEAVQIHQDVNSRQSIGMHYGTFPLADEGRDEPKQDLAKAREKYGINEEMFCALEEGETKVFVVGLPADFAG